MLYSFDSFQLNTEERSLKRCENPIPLTPKVFETLLVLVENHDRVVSKDELLNSIWPERFVEEANLTQNVSVLRKALGEASSGKKYIATFSGRGYRFLEPVVVDERSFLPPTLPDVKSGAASDLALLPPSRTWTPANHFRLALTSACAVIFLVATVLVAGHLKPRDHAIASVTIPVLAPSGPIRTAVRMEGAQYQPTWSASGSQLAFVHADGDGATSAIYIQTVGQMHPRRITFGTGEYSSPAFSPDGRSLAFLHMRPEQSEILIYNLATAQTRKLATLSRTHYGLSCRQLDWSPGGEFLVVDGKEAESDPLSLYQIFVSNGDKVRLTYPDTDILGDTSPSFSPDGAQLAFIRMKYQYEYDVFVVSVIGGTPRRLTSEPGIVGDVGWNGSGRVVYTGDQDGEFRLWQVDLSAASPQPVLASTIATDMPLQFSIGRKARQIAFSGYRPDLNIWALNLSKTAPAQSGWKPVIHTPGQDITPFFSPDGKSIAFRSDVSGRFQLWISRADGSNAVAIPTGSLPPGVFGWGPDSQSLIFCSPATRGIYQVSLSSGFPVRKVSDAPGSHPFYSVDGNWIFATAGNIIYRIPAAGGPAEVITDHGGSPIEQSRDGRYLFFGHRRMDTTISRLDLLTHKQETMVHSLIPGYHDAWTITDGGILFLTEEKGVPAIAFHDFRSSKDHRISAFPGRLPIIATSHFSVSPDGHTLLVVRADPASANIKTASFFAPEEYAAASAPGER